MATESHAKSDARQAQVMADAIEIEERRQAENPDEAPVGSRFEVRRDGSGWAVVDTNTGRVARRGARAAAGLSRTTAEQAAWELQRDDNEATYRAAMTSAFR